MRDKVEIDFIGIGAARSGTSWTAKCLMQHPQICFPYLKELNYFSRTRANKTKSEYDFNGIQGYLKMFVHCPAYSIKGEFSTYYLQDPEVPNLIKKHFPYVKILVCLRDPVERAFSDYQNVKRAALRENDSFEEAFFSSKQNPLDSYRERGMYYKQLKRYFELFPMENIKMIIFDDIKKKPMSVLRDLYTFLNVDPEFVPRDLSPEGGVVQTKYVGIRKSVNFLRGTYNFLESREMGKPLAFIKRKTRINHFFEKINQMNTKKFEKPTLDHELKRRLKKVYLDDLTKLEKLIRKDLRSWK